MLNSIAFKLTIFIFSLLVITFIEDNAHCVDFQPYRNQNGSIHGAFNYSQFQPFKKIVKELRQLSKHSSKEETYRLFSIGKTFQRRNLWAFQIKINDGKKRQTIVIDCGAHAREWIAPATCMYVIKQFVSSKREKNLTNIIKKFNWVFVPVLNPDGYVYSWHNKSTRLWRKNRSATKEQIKLRKEKGAELCIGVDINRNFDQAWGGPGAPTNNPCFEMYAGSKPFSEKESSALADYLVELKEDLVAYVTLHAFSQSWMTPWGYKSKKPKKYNDMIDVAKKAVAAMKEFSGIEYVVGPSHNVLYPNSGSSSDWVYSKLNVPFSYIVEMFPDANTSEKEPFLVPPLKMIQNAKEILVGLTTMAESIEI